MLQIGQAHHPEGSNPNGPLSDPAHGNSVSKVEEFVLLDSRERRFVLSVKPHTRYKLSVEFRPGSAPEKLNESLATVKFLRKDDTVVPAPYQSIATSSKVGPFLYLKPVAGKDAIAIAYFFTPEDAASVQLGLRTWSGKNRKLEVRPHIELSERPNSPSSDPSRVASSDGHIERTIAIQPLLSGSVPNSKSEKSTGQNGIEYLPIVPALPLTAPVAIEAFPTVLAEIPCQPEVPLHFAINFLAPEKLRSRNVLVSYACFNGNKELNYPVKGKLKSEKDKIGYYEYIEAGESGLRNLQVVPTAECNRLRISFYSWGGRAAKASYMLENAIALRRGFGALTSEGGDTAVVAPKQVVDVSSFAEGELVLPPQQDVDTGINRPPSIDMSEAPMKSGGNSLIEPAEVAAVLQLLEEYELHVEQGLQVTPGADNRTEMSNDRLASFSIVVTPNSLIRLRASFLTEGAAVSSKDALVAVGFLDGDGLKVQGGNSNTLTSSRFERFRYLDPVDKVPNATTVDIVVPDRAKRAVLEIYRWKATQPLRLEGAVRIIDVGKLKSVAHTRARFSAWIKEGRRTNSVVNELSPSARTGTQVTRPREALQRSKDVRVAMICDEFTYNSYKDELNAVSLEPETWREQFQQHKPQVLFCESAWSGRDSKRRSWKGQIYASVNFKTENRTTLLKILEHCRKSGIPTVFWNKEDPTHYSDRVHDFVKTAREFDFVFTSAAECIEGYRREHGVKRAFVLPFATNPRLFSPIEVAPRSSNMVFAGSWYGNHERRSAEMEQIFGALMAQGHVLEIYDRYWGDTDPLHKWPSKYLPFVKPSQPHSSMPQVYKSSRFGVNFNTVTDSSTMFARRVFELMSCNTLVVSNYSRGVEEMFGELVVFADREPERLRSMSASDVDVLRERALSLVLREHTYAKRWREILKAIGMEVDEADDRLTVAVLIRGREDALRSIAWFQQQRVCLPDARLLLVIDSMVSGLETAALYREFNRFGIGVTSAQHAFQYSLQGRYRPIETDHFLGADVQTLPDGAWVQMASLHLQYMNDYPIVQALNTESRFRIAPSRTGLPMIANAAQFGQWLRPSNQPASAYYV